MSLPLRYTRTHEWAYVDDKGCVVVGISEHAVKQLGDVVFVELPESGKALKASEEVVVIESVKAAADVYAPVAGRVVEVNHALEDKPELVNESPQDKGWLFKIEPISATDIDALLDEDAYHLVCAE